SVQLHAFERATAHEFAEDLGRFEHAAFSTHGRWLAASGQKCAGVWDLASGGPAVLNDDHHTPHFFFSPDARELFGCRGSASVPDCFRWRLGPAIPQSGTSGPPSLEPLPLHKPEGFTFLGLRSNTVVMTGSNGSQILAPEEMENGSERWGPTVSGINGVSPGGRWLAICPPRSLVLFIYGLPGFEGVAK